MYQLKFSVCPELCYTGGLMTYWERHHVSKSLQRRDKHHNQSLTGKGEPENKCLTSKGGQKGFIEEMAFKDK